MFNIHNFGNKHVAEAISEGILIDSVEAGTDLLGNTYYQGGDILVVHKKHFSTSFFDLKKNGRRYSPEVFQLPHETVYHR